MPAVVKLGGSTASHQELAVWIEALAGASLSLVIVPGGGPFAGQVRDAQKRIGFSDDAAHVMALLAMEQFGQVILERHARFRPARTLEDMQRALAEGKIPVWLPSSMVVTAPDIPASWDITSDSLAAWLAGRLGATALLLIKQTGALSDRDDVQGLTRRGIVDPCLATMLPSGINLYLAGPHHAAAAAQALAAGTLPGTRIESLVPAEKAG